MTIQANGRDIGPDEWSGDIEMSNRFDRAVLSGAELATIRNMVRRDKIVRGFLHANWRVVLGCCWHEPAVLASVLRVLWQRRRLRRALARRGVPKWISE